MTPPANTRALSVEDRERQTFVTLALVFCLVSALVGLGLLGEPVDAVGGGVLAPDATVLAPAQWTFLLWRPIYLGFIAYTVWQWFPAQRANPVHRTIGWHAGWAMIMAGGWIMITQHGWLWAGVLLLFAMVVTLARLMDAVTAPRRPGAGASPGGVWTPRSASVWAGRWSRRSPWWPPRWPARTSTSAASTRSSASACWRWA